MDIEHGMERITIDNMSDQTHLYANDVLFHAKEMVEKEKITMDQALKCFEIGFKEQWLDLHCARYADQSNAELERVDIERRKIYGYEE
ncbi:hypothetical protein [Ligilactobacillus saerimneri]|uniref:hypothetical protein n=1 Tax=Ligilactobacillus saerimneri TaxID=228229 RepID=UPI0029426428|nr:hypothetical protein [Ligilactobacillus saerimneri]